MNEHAMASENGSRRDLVLNLWWRGAVLNLDFYRATCDRAQRHALSTLCLTKAAVSNVSQLA